MPFSKIVDISGEEIFRAHGIRRTFPAGSIIAERGEPVQDVYFLKKGQVRTFFLNSDGVELTLFYINAGNMFCTESFIAQPETIVSLAAETDVDVYQMKANQFLQEWERRGYSVQKLLAHFVRRVLTLSDTLCCMRFPKNEERLAYYLFSQYAGGSDEVHLTHMQLAEMTGMSIASANRILKSFTESGAISCDYGAIRIRKPDLLAETFHSLGYHTE